jgi:predicted permease
MIHAADAIARDLRYALRVLRRSPAFTSAAVLTLGLSIGINTAVFSVVDAVLLRPLPYPAPGRLALVQRIVRTQGQEGRGTAVDGRTWERVRDRVTGARAAVFSGWASGVNLVATDQGAVGRALYVQQQRVGSGFFSVLGVVPLIGREFTPVEDRAGGPGAAILSASLWQTTFGTDPGVVGRSIMLRGEPHTVVGVMPDRFESGVRADVWTPLRPSTTGQGSGENYAVLLRVVDGVSTAALDGELARIAGDLQAERPAAQGVSVSLGLVPLQQGLVETLRRPLLLLWAAVAMVLLVACVNLAGLLLARSAGRTPEIATRMALGSGRTAVVRQLLVESLMLGVFGGVAGVVVGMFALDGLRTIAGSALGIWQPLALDVRAVSVAALLSVIAAAVFGTAPALQASRFDLRSGLVAGGMRSIAGGPQRWTRRALVVTQVALGAVLLVGAGLLVRTFTHLNSLDPGFDPAGVTTAAISLEDARYRSAADVQRLFSDTLARLQVPGIESAAVALGLPYQRILNIGFRHADGPQAADQGRITSATYVTPGFFQTMRIAIRQGRGLEDGDRASTAPVAVVNAAFVRTYFGGEPSVGRRIRLGGVDREIVGVAGDVQVRPGWGDNGPLAPMPLVYLPVAQVSDGFLQLVHGWFEPTFIVRSALPAAQTSTALRRALDAVDPLLPFADVRPMSDVKALSLAEPRLLMALISVLAAATLLLTAVGIHGLIATSVAERTREIGIRLALGATPADTMRTIARPGVVLAVAGTAAGLLLALAAVRLIRHFVWGVSATDPATFAAVAVVLLAVAASASVVPTLRILRLDPAQTLRRD